MAVTNGALLVDAFGRVREIVHGVLGAATPETVSYRPDPGANSIGWLCWHLARVQDDHVADLAGTEQVWTAGGFADRFALPYPPAATGYGHRPEEVGAFSATAESLVAYLDAVHQATVAFLDRIGDADLDRVVDTSWDPPVTMGVRLVSVLSDNLQHAGQAAFVAGLAARAG